MIRSFDARVAENDESTSVAEAAACTLEPASSIPVAETSGNEDGYGDLGYEDPEVWLATRQRLYDDLTEPYPTSLGKRVNNADCMQTNLWTAGKPC